MNSDILTDYILAAITFLIGTIYIYYKKSYFWAFAFILLGLAAYFGAKFHANNDQDLWLWHMSLISIGVASTLMLLAIADNDMVIVGAFIKLYLYLHHLTTRKDKTSFTPAIINTFIALMTVLYVTWGTSPLLSAGILISASGNVLQYLTQDNTMFHLLQIGSMVMIGMGAFKIAN